MGSNKINITANHVDHPSTVTTTALDPKLQHSQELIEISELSKKIQELRQEIDRTPEIDQNKVNQIKQALQDGTYHIDVESTAKKIVEMEFIKVENTEL